MHWADLAFVLSLCEYYDLCGAHIRISASINLFHSRRRRENSFVSVLEDDVDGLVEALQRSDEVAAVGGDDGHQTVDVLLQRRGHGNEIWIVSRIGNKSTQFFSLQTAEIKIEMLLFRRNQTTSNNFKGHGGFSFYCPNLCSHFENRFKRPKKSRKVKVAAVGQS